MSETKYCGTTASLAGEPTKLSMQPDQLADFVKMMEERRALIALLPECGLLKFSQLLVMCEFFAELPLVRSIYLREDDIMLHKNFHSLVGADLSQYYVHVGSRVERYIKSGEKISAMGWAWFRAKDMGLERPCVSMA